MTIPGITVFSSRRRIAAWAPACVPATMKEPANGAGTPHLIECAQGAARARNCQFHAGEAAARPPSQPHIGPTLRSTLDHDAEGTRHRPRDMVRPKPDRCLMHIPGRNARSGPENDFNTIVRTKPGAGPESAVSRATLSTLCSAPWTPWPRWPDTSVRPGCRNDAHILSAGRALDALRRPLVLHLSQVFGSSPYPIS